MKTTKIVIKNLFGIEEKELDGRSVEITGTNGAGKSSVIDAIRYGLTNSSDREFIIRDGEREGEILIETDSGLAIARKKRTDKTDYKSIKENKKDVPSPETFLQTLFTPLQLNPVEFLAMSKQDQNRAILDLIDFDWDINWIKEQFGEVPAWVDYDNNILQVLADIQSEKGEYFTHRQDINREIRNKKAFVDEIRGSIPGDYDVKKWKEFNLGAAYDKIIKAEQSNNKIERAKAFLDSYNNKVRGIEADSSIEKSSVDKRMNDRKTELAAAIEKFKGEIKACETELSMLGEKAEKEYEIINEKEKAAKSALNHDMGIARDWAGRETVDVSDLKSEAAHAEEMIKLINEYDRMKKLQADIAALGFDSDALTEKIEKARELPGEILKESTIPVEGLTVENGMPLVHGLPVSNLSEGEKLSLCVDVAAANPNALSLILLDGTEKLSDGNREKLYAKCKEKGLQFIATRTTNSNELEITTL